MNLQVFNQGIGGDKLVDLANRWQTDCLDFEPDLVSIFIGINDVWHHRNSETPIDKDYIATFDQTYRRLLTELRQQNPEVQIVLMQPFVLPTLEDRLDWKEELDPMIAVINQITSDFDADLIPLSEHFNTLVETYDPNLFTVEDGVHPVGVGHGVIASQWLEKLDVAQH